jgi:hypothetical protein
MQLFGESRKHVPVGVEGHHRAPVPAHLLHLKNVAALVPRVLKTQYQVQARLFSRVGLKDGDSDSCQAATLASGSQRQRYFAVGDSGRASQPYLSAYLRLSGSMRAALLSNSSACSR